jgi:hypothetical protein
MRTSAACPVAVTIVCAAGLSATVHAQKTDVVTLANGDRITGEVQGLERGRLEYKTDDAGTLYLEWDKLVSVVATTRSFEVYRSDGERFLGSLNAAQPRTLALVGPAGTTTLQMADVTLITPIGKSFWAKLDGSVDVGYSYTKSSGISQLFVNSDTTYNRPGFQGRLTGSLTQTHTEDGENEDDRGSIEASYLRYLQRRWFVTSAARFETNESLGLELRSQFGGGVGPRLVDSNKAQVVLAGGGVVNAEKGVDVETTYNVEGLVQFRASYWAYDFPKTNFDVNAQYYPSLSDPGRHRLQFDSAIKREFFKDFIVSFNFFDTFDSRPPNPDFARNDVGVVFSVGWTY